MTLALRYAARSDPGLLRTSNQDSVYAGPHLLAVADGIGGSAAGDIASSIVVNAMASVDRDVPADSVLDALRSGVEAADQSLREAMDTDQTLEGMGTTLTSLLFAGDTVGLAHIGDSRAYLLRGGELVQVTRDDSYVQLLVDEGRISADDANSHPYRSVVTKAMQGSAPDAQYALLRVSAGDRFLLCSDGLSSVVRAETLAEVLDGPAEPGACVEQLIELALRAGGPDNITVIVADVVAGAEPDRAPVLSVAAPAGMDARTAPPPDDTVVFDRVAVLQAIQRDYAETPSSNGAATGALPRSRHAGEGGQPAGTAGRTRHTVLRVSLAAAAAAALLGLLVWYVWLWLTPA